jgi:Phosphotransferase enzyme family
MGALRRIVCETFRISDSDCGPPIPVGVLEYASYARVYYFSLPGSCSVIARLVAPVKPLFKTEGEVAAMDFVRSRTSLPVPKVFAYSSEVNPVGVEWVLMEYMPGVELGKAWKTLDYDKKTQFAVDLVDMYDQLSQLRACCCGAVYHSTRRSMDDRFSPTSLSQNIRSPRWKPLSSDSLRSLRAHCNHPLYDSDGLYEIGPLQDSALLQYPLIVPSPSQTAPVFTTTDYVRLLAYNGFRQL